MLRNLSILLEYEKLNIIKRYKIEHDELNVLDIDKDLTDENLMIGKI